MTDPIGAAERFLLAYVSGGEEMLAGRLSDDIFGLAGADLEELLDQGPETVAVAWLHVMVAAVDVVANLADEDRAAGARRIIAVSEQRRAAR